MHRWISELWCSRQTLRKGALYFTHEALFNRQHFTLQTDQKSVTFMFNQKHKGKIKNDKMLCWRIELSCYSFDIVYKPSWDNIPPDALSRISYALPNDESLWQLHDALCHPGVTRLAHFIRIRNLPYSIADIKRVVSSCQICCECKPQFYWPEPGNLVKATQPFERLNIDFKGPLPRNNQNKYFLNVVDEYSRFPFVFPWRDLSTEGVIQALTSLFTVYGMPAFIHSYRGVSFMNRELREFLTSKGVSTGRPTPYIPAGNGQVVKYQERSQGGQWGNCPPIPKVAPKIFRVIKLLMLITRVLLTLVCSISRNHQWTSCIFVFVQFSKWKAVLYVLHALKLKLWLRSNQKMKVFFITQIGHRPGVSNSKRRPNENLHKKQDRNMMLTHQKLCLKLTRNSCYIFFLRMISWVIGSLSLSISTFV